MKRVRNVNFVARRVAEKTAALPKQFGSTALISITDPDYHDAQLQDGVWHSVLRLKFHDVDRQNNEGTLRIFAPEDAYRVLHFLKQHEDDVDSVIAHCEAGISRSAACAKFVAMIYGLQFPENYYLYNKLVFSTLLKCYRELIDQDSEVPGLVR